MLKVLIIGEKISTLALNKDTTIGIIRQGWKRKWSIYYATPEELSLRNNHVFAKATLLIRSNSSLHFCGEGAVDNTNVEGFDAVLCRADPPVNDRFMTMLYILKFAEKKNILVVNSAKGISEINEKLFPLLISSKLTPPTLVSGDSGQLLQFIKKYKQVIIKPINSMGGNGIFKVNCKESNTNVILETMLATLPSVLVQKYVPEIKKGDNRVFIVDNKVLPYKIVRMPAKNEHRANLAAGGKALCKKLTSHEVMIAEEVLASISRYGIVFAGLDIIGKYLIEINVTSPTLARELYAQSGFPIFNQICLAIENRCNKTCMK